MNLQVEPWSTNQANPQRLVFSDKLYWSNRGLSANDGAIMCLESPTVAVAVASGLDHPDVRAYVARQLRRHYRVVEAADGEQALARMREAVPDLVVSDPVQAGVMTVMAVAETAKFNIDRLKRREF